MRGLSAASRRSGNARDRFGATFDDTRDEEEEERQRLEQ